MTSDHSRVLILLGMHRSGTSLTANWLHHCGLELGDRMLTGDESNPTGHYEDQDFLQFHKDVLEDNDTDYTYHGESPLELSPYHRARAAALVRFKSTLYPQWGWKEPRTCLFTDLYHELLPQAKYLILVRPPHKVIDSLMQRDWTSIELALRDHPVKRWYKSYLLKKQRDTRAVRYAQAYLHYNQELLRLIDRLPPDSYSVATTEGVKKRSTSLLENLRGWGFQLTGYPIEAILFDKPAPRRRPWTLPSDLETEVKNVHSELLEFRTKALT